MRLIIAAIVLAIASSGILLAQPLTCPAVSSATGRPCDAFHYHVQMYRPDTRTFVELFGINQFASQSACERARDAQFKRNMAVVEVYRARKDQQYQPDRFGPCHCDMTVERSSPNYLTDALRAGQVRLADDIRQRVRERLLDLDVPSDSDVVRGLILIPPTNPLLGAPRLAPLPQRGATAESTRSPDDLKTTRAVDANTQSAAALDLPLIDIAIPGLPTVPVAETAVTPTPAAAPAPAPSPVPAPAPSTPQIADPPPQPLPAAQSETTVVDDDATEAFVSYETQRIQNVLKASSAITDEAARSKVLEACMQRIQLLSNLRSLIQGSGARSRLAAAARAAKNEPERLALVSKLFGSDIPKHWAPHDATDVILDTHDVDADPERVLRDSSGKFGEAQKRHALYVILARTQPTEEQQLWLSAVVDALLQ